MRNDFGNTAEYRDELCKLIRLEMYGPLRSDGEQDKSRKLKISPLDQFSCGVIFPLETDPQEIQNSQQDIPKQIDLSTLKDDDIEIKSNSSATNLSSLESVEQEPSLDLTSQHRPSSIAITFKRMKKNSISIECNFSKYTKSIVDGEGPYSEYIRTQYINVITTLKPNETLKEPSGQLSLRSKVRDLGDGSEIITISLVNSNVGLPRKEKLRRVFFQPEIIVTCEQGFESLEPEREYFQDPELASDALLYRKKQVYCRGHGCAGDWQQEIDGGKTTQVHSNCFPEHEVRPIEPKNGISGVDLSFDANSRWGESEDIAREIICNNLSKIVDDYQAWINKLRETKLDEYVQSTANKHLKNCEYASARMRSGIEILRNNDLCFRAFRIANRSMLMQQFHGALKGDETYGKNISYEEVGYLTEAEKRGWRPFQLAFLLMNLNCIKSVEGHDEKLAELVDLIWFPTGGGKTEAYLGVAAYSIALSKLQKPRGNSTDVIMRYTLRLLSAQQFERAATLMMALELMRFRGELGAECQNYGKPIRAGLWVGASLTPNKIDKAKTALRELRNNADAPNPFQILACPWCKTDLRQGNFEGYKFNRHEKNIDFKCLNADCDYGNQVLPISVIDENLYKNPPTLLLGTVDKFTQLAWLQEPRVFLGYKTGYPPSLIIQDELHLISGPLGSIVGHYEVLLQKICNHYGNVPKIIASTATIRRAEQQVRSLYNREVAAFPPPGLSYDDSYFAQETKDKNKPGRRYVGIFASATNSHVTAQRNLLAPLLQFPTSAFDDFLVKETNDNTGETYLTLQKNCAKPALDPYGTIIWYFNSLRELGYADTLLVSDISEYLKNLCSRYSIHPFLRRLNLQVEELTSRAKDSAISEILALLEKSWTPKPWGNKKCLDVLLATNMISVGVDINRLGLMVITGQPKSTSEYIQASSRVGRTHPGLVFTLYNQARSRDRSHFEMFKTYHQALYRAVEPSSVTPFSYKARERALPGLIIGLARNIFSVSDPNDFTEDISAKIEDELEDYLDIVRANTNSIEEVASASEQINQILKIWSRRNAGETLTWGSMGGTIKEEDLMLSTGQNTSKFPNKIEVMTSMRNVDLSARATIASSIVDID